MTSKTILFSSKKEARLLPPNLPESRTPYAWHKHETHPGFYIRASKADKTGKFDLRYVHRYKISERQPDGSFQPKEKRDDLGPVVQLGKKDYEEALGKFLARRKELMKEDGETEVSVRLTIASAWAFCVSERFKNKDATKEKEGKLFQRYFGHISHRYLDELSRAFWSEFLNQLREGTLVVGQKEREDGRGTEPVHLGPLVPASQVGVMNVAALLYDIGNKNGGLRGELKGTNNPADLRKNIGRPNKKTSYIPMSDLGTAWRASDQLISPWWRDMFQVFVLTGLRRSLLFSMRFDEIDFEKGILYIDPRKRGAKRKGERITSDTKDIRMPLSQYVLDMLKRRREFVPDENGPVWFSPKPTRGRQSTKETALLSDPRSAWTLIEGTINLHFSPHDLRRTFATCGTVATKDLFAVSLLLLHTGEELAKAAGIPSISIQYMNTDEALERMRAATEEITAHVLKLASMPLEEAKKLVEPVLHRELEEALTEKD